MGCVNSSISSPRSPAKNHNVNRQNRQPNKTREDIYKVSDIESDFLKSNLIKEDKLIANKDEEENKNKKKLDDYNQEMHIDPNYA
jgi:hypothetical protein